MNPRTLVQITLALLAHNGTITKEQAADLLHKANNGFEGQVLDELSLEQMIDLLDNPEPPKPSSLFETPEPPRIIT